MLFNTIKKLLSPDDIGSEGMGSESANMTEAADQSTDSEDYSDDESEGDEVSGSQDGSTDQGEEVGTARPQSAEDNSKYAQARRAAEQQMRAFQLQQNELDSQFAAMFGDYTNPVTGQPIKTAKDYLEAMQAQNKMNQEQELQRAGLDPKLIDRTVQQAVATNPAIRQAQQVIERNRQEEAQRMIQEDVEKIKALDPTVTSMDDISKQENFQQLLQYVQTHPGTRLHEAYQIVNFAKLTSMQKQAAEQKAVNETKSKTHLTSSPGMTGSDNLVDIPVDEVKDWKRWFPGKTNKELKQLYNKTLKVK